MARLRGVLTFSSIKESASFGGALAGAGVFSAAEGPSFWAPALRSRGAPACAARPRVRGARRPHTSRRPHRRSDARSGNRLRRREAVRKSGKPVGWRTIPRPGRSPARARLRLREPRQAPCDPVRQTRRRKGPPARHPAPGRAVSRRSRRGCCPALYCAAGGIAPHRV